MNPFPMLLADLRALRWTMAAIVGLIAIAVAVGVTVMAQERAFRKSSAAAVEDFDLIIAAPGSSAQVLLTTAFLQPEALPLMAGSVFQRVLGDRRVKAAAPVALGDVSSGYPLVGTTRAFASRWGRLRPVEGRMFAKPFEAVAGADVARPIGAVIQPAHGHAGSSRTPGVAEVDEDDHRHADAAYTIVGRMPRLGTPFDQAILVPIESVWSVHGLGQQAQHPASETDGPFESFSTKGTLPGVPALVVKPRSIADAYALRAEYRQGGAMAFFPAEVLVQLYGALGDVRDLLIAAAILNALLIFAAVLLLLWAVMGLRRRRYAILRALGAPRAYILLLVWLNAVVPLVAGCCLGLLLGWGATLLAGQFLAATTGFSAGFVFDLRDLALILLELAVASVMALIPALLAYRVPVAEGLR